MSRRILPDAEPRCRATTTPAIWWTVQGECPMREGCARHASRLPMRNASIEDFRANVRGNATDGYTCQHHLSLHAEPAPAQRRVHPPIGSQG